MGGETMATIFLEPADNKKHQLACMEIRPGQWHNRPRQRVLELINNLYTASFSKNIILAMLPFLNLNQTSIHVNQTLKFSISIHINITVQERDFAHFL